MSKDQPPATILSGVEKCVRIIEGIKKLHFLFSSNSQILDRPPLLDKSNCRFFCDNSENALRFQQGYKCKYSDNFRNWDYSFVSYITSYYLSDSLQIVFKRDSEFFIRKQMKGVRRFIRLEPQPDYTNIISVSRYNLTHKKGNFQRRITTMTDPTNPEFKNKALYQYIGIEPFDAKLNNTKTTKTIDINWKNIGTKSRPILAQDDDIRNREEMYNNVRFRTRRKIKKNQSTNGSDENSGEDSGPMSTLLDDELSEMANMEDYKLQNPAQCFQYAGTHKMDEEFTGDHLESMPQKKCYVGRMTPKAQKVRAARMSESEDRRAKRLAADRMRQAISRLKESDETRAVRLEKMRIRKQEQRLRITQQRNARNLRQAVDAVVDKTMRLHEASVHFNVAQGKISSQIKKLKTAKKTKGGRRSTATIGLNPVFETLSSTDSVYEYFPQSKPTDDDAEDQKKQERQFGDNFSEETCQMSFAESTSSSPTQMRVQQQKEILLVANHQNSIMSNLVSLWKSGKLCDAAISNGSTTIKVHKVVLSAVCPNLLSTCSADFFSHKFMQVNFPKEVSAETLNVFAEYMYKGVLNLDPDILEQLKIIANKLAMKEFEELCDRHLPKNNQQSETPAADTADDDALLNNNRLSQTQTVPIVHTTRTLPLASVDSSAVSGPVIQTGPSIENPFINIKQEISEDGLMAMVVSLLPDKTPTSSVVDPLVKIEVVGPEDGKYEHWSSSGNEHALTSTTLSSSIAPATRASVPSTASSVPSSSTAPSSSSSSTVFTIPFLKATNIKSARLKTTPCSEAPPLISELSSVSRIVKTGCWSQPNLINVDSSKMSKWPSVSISPIDGPSNTNKELVYPIELFTSRGDNLPLPKTDS